MNKIERYHSFKCKTVLLFFLIVLFHHRSFSQNIIGDSSDIEIEIINQKIESIAEQTDASLDYTDLLENLNYYYVHPINLNNTNSEELEKLLILNDVQINNFFEHINRNGKLLSLYELQSIAGFDLETISRLLPYVYVSGEDNKHHFTLKEMLNKGSNQLLIRYQQVIEKQQGFSPISDSALSANPNSRYLGSPEALFAKYRFSYYNNVSMGITADKDAGEEFFKGSQKKGFDFYSAHFFMQNIGIIKALAIGDFQAQFGQGLTLWTGLGFGMSSDGTGIKKNAQGIGPYTSVTDNLYMRGIGTTIGIKDFELSVFFSDKKIDANITSTDSLTNEVLLISSLQQTGLHTTPGEIADKNAITETSAGGHFCYRTTKLNIGATAFKSTYSAPLHRQPEPYNQFEFNGKTNSNIGFDYSYIFKNMNLFGEVSQSGNNAKALLSGLLICPDNKVSLSILYRNYNKSYQALYSSAFGESSIPANEKGLYAGILFKPVHTISINAYFDNISFPWLKYRIDAPSRATDYLVQCNWKPSKKIEMYARFRQTCKELNDVNENEMFNIPVNTLKQNYRLDASYQVSASVRFKNRIEIIHYKIGNGAIQKGFLIYQDIIYKKMKSPFSFSIRYALFDADTYDCRIYAYENDVLDAYSIPALYDKGSRFYFNIKYSINKIADVWLRFAQTSYSNINVIGSGLTQINGNVKSEVKVQLRFKF